MSTETLLLLIFVLLVVHTFDHFLLEMRVEKLKKLNELLEELDEEPRERTR